MARRRWIVCAGALAIALLLNACDGGSSSSSSSTAVRCDPARDACRVAQIAARQTHLYELAGAPPKQAGCLAAVTSQMKAPPGQSKAIVIASLAQEQAMDRCGIDDRTFDRIGSYLQQHAPVSGAIRSKR